MKSSASCIRFLLNGREMSLERPEPTVSVLALLRERYRATGTKEGCAEGDCGACTVVLGEAVADGLRMRAVNACIQFTPTLDGKALFTVEYLRRQAGGALHPVQQAMVEHHGSQCGFCTPGFVMSLWNTYNDHTAAGTRPGRQELANQLSGNLCRCTGYRPILDAGEAMFDLPGMAFDATDTLAALERITRNEMLVYEHSGCRYMAPRSLAEFIELKRQYANATVLAGCTDIGLWVNKQFRDLGDIIYIGNIPELARMEVADDCLCIGAGVSLTDAYSTLDVYYPELREMWERFASVPIRNAGTLGGNVANGSPIGDSMPWLIALGATVVLNGPHGRRGMELESLYTGYMEKAMSAEEFVERVDVPLPRPHRQFRTYKLAKRYDSDISAVCAAFALTLDDQRVVDARVAFGGMAAVPARAEACERALSGAAWNEATVRRAMAALADDFTPLSDMRASADYRQRTAANLLYRFYLESRKDKPLTPGQSSVFRGLQEAI